MKKFLLIILACMFLTSLVACSKKQESKPLEPTEPIPNTTMKPVIEPERPPSEKEVYYTEKLPEIAKEYKIHPITANIGQTKQVYLLGKDNSKFFSTEGAGHSIEIYQFPDGQQYIKTKTITENPEPVITWYRYMPNQDFFEDNEFDADIGIFFEDFEKIEHISTENGIDKLKVFIETNEENPSENIIAEITIKEETNEIISIKMNADNVSIEIEVKDYVDSCTEGIEIPTDVKNADENMEEIMSLMESITSLIE